MFSKYLSATDQSILKNILIIIPLSLIGRSGAFLIYAVLANWFGVSRGMDFLYYHWGAAMFMTEVLSSASAYSVLIPVLAEERAKDHKAASVCLRAIFATYLIGMPMACLVIAAGSYLASLFFLPQSDLPGGATIGVVVGFAVFTICASIRWLLKAVLDAYQRFHLPAILQGARVPIVIGLIYALRPSLGIYSIVPALIAGEVFQAAVLLSVCRFSLHFRGLFSFWNASRHWREYGGTAHFYKKYTFMMGAAVADGINPVVDRGMASTLAAGSVSKLDYALKICAVPESLAGMLFPVLLSHWSEISADSDIKRLQKSVWKGALVIVAVMGPALAGLFYFSAPVIRLLYGHGVMSETELLHISSLFRIYLIGMLPRLVSRLLVRAHLSIQNVRFIFSMTLIRAILNPVLNFVFMRFWGLEGIALATALPSIPIAAYIGVVFWIASNRKMRSANYRR